MEVTYIVIENLKRSLSQTDYVVTKIAEAETIEEQQALRIKYADVLNQRKQWRAQINELEEHPMENVPTPAPPSWANVKENDMNESIDDTSVMNELEGGEE